MLVEIFGSFGTMTLLDFFFGWGGGGGAGVHFDYNIVIQQFYSYIAYFKIVKNTLLLTASLKWH